MKKTIVLIRCTEWTPRTELLAKQLSSLTIEVIAVPDLINVKKTEHQEALSKFNCRTLPLTESFLEEYKLPFWDDRNRTGWACGDYVLYRALELEWDYAWIVEPDLYFLNGAESLLGELQDSNIALFTTNIWKASPDWYWSTPLLEADPEMNVFAMAFPFSRVSRELAVSALKLRQETAQHSTATSRVPNDESIVATAANRSGFSILDLKKERSQWFRYWSTKFKYPIADIERLNDKPHIVHSGLSKEEIPKYFSELWDGIKNGDALALNRFKATTAAASDHTLKELLNSISSAEFNKQR